MSAHASQAFSIAHCTDSEDLPELLQNILVSSCNMTMPQMFTQVCWNYGHFAYWSFFLQDICQMLYIVRVQPASVSLIITLVQFFASLQNAQCVAC